MSPSLFDAFTSKDDLDRRLRDGGMSAAAARELSGLWVDGAVPTFPADATTSFRSATFEQPERCEFAEVDLANCLFAGTVMKGIKLSNVTWPDRMTFPLGRRLAVRDEMEAKSPPESVRQLYAALEANYHEGGMFREASDFRYGKMEMLRQAAPPALRGLSVLAAYKYLSGYGERYGLALGWLALFVLLAFPALYLATGLQGGAGMAVLRSPEVSTFLEPTGESEAQIATRFVEGIERLVVPLQAGLFALAVNRRLGKA